MQKRLKFEDVLFSEDNKNLDNYVEVWFADGERAPMVGFFVKMNDWESLKEKHFVRFVRRRNDFQFQNKPNILLTSLFDCRTFKCITLKKLVV